ncbi:MAG: histidine kinase dimerization/phospho-acceptor domain-containing protein [Acidobacteriota bacterium]|nr:histidine kinase dimerization/phospho-acceptor domain-containing protein [Acidobacteriota bacterium]
METRPSRADAATTFRSSPWARWGLLVVALAMAAALVASAVAGHREAVRSARELSVVSGMSLVRSVMRDLTRADEDPAQALEWIVESLRDEGLLYAGLYDEDQRPVAAAGEPAADPVAFPAPRRIRTPVAVSGGRLRLVSPPLPSGRRRHHRGPSPRFSAPAMAPPWHHAFLVVEYLPLRSIALRRRAGRTLALNLAAALVLAAAAAFFWRLSRLADRAREQLVRDRRLKDLGQMSAVLGHEVRNPLASLKGNAQLLLEKTPRDDPSRPQVERIVSEARRLETLTRQVLDFARSGRLERAPVPVAQVVENAVRRSAADPVQVDIPANLPTWYMDRDRVEQLLENLLTNARAASPPREASWRSTSGSIGARCRSRSVITDRVSRTGKSNASSSPSIPGASRAPASDWLSPAASPRSTAAPSPRATTRGEERC